MIYDIDLIDHLVTLIKAANWSSAIADIRRVWGGDVNKSELSENRLICQLWPDGQRHSRIAQSGPWSTTVEVGVLFALRLSQKSMAEVDAAMQSFDNLLISEESGMGGEAFDVLSVSSMRSGTVETATFCREKELLWTLRPNPELLQRIQPDGDQEQYAGLLHCQALMTYNRL